jgi:hypothetical protein
MSRTVVALSALGLVALVLMVSLIPGSNGPARLVSPAGSEGPMVHGRTGEIITLEAVTREAEWHRETAQKLRDLK